MASGGSYELAPKESSEEEGIPFLSEKRQWRNANPVDRFNKVMAFVNVILALILAISLGLISYSWTASTTKCKESPKALQPYCKLLPRTSVTSSS